MSANPTLPIVYGAVGATPITGNVNSATLAKIQTVTLGATAYVRSVPPGQAPLCPTDRLAPLLLRFTRKPGMRETRLENRNPIREAF
jgi:hypothetical protein